LFEKKKTKQRFFLSKVCLTCNFAEAFWFLIKEELLCVVCEAVVEHLVLHGENILHFN